MIILAISMALLILAIVLVLLFKRQLGEKYAALWLVIGVLALILACFPGLLGWVAGLIGVQVPSNLFFALAIVLLLAVALHLSWELSRAEDEVRRLAEEAALASAAERSLRSRVERLEALAGISDERPAPPGDTSSDEGD